MGTRLRVEAAYILVTLGGWTQAKARGVLGISPTTYLKYQEEMRQKAAIPPPEVKPKKPKGLRCRYCKVIPVEGICNCIEPQQDPDAIPE